MTEPLALPSASNEYYAVPRNPYDRVMQVDNLRLPRGWRCNRCAVWCARRQLLVIPAFGCWMGRHCPGQSLTRETAPRGELTL